MAKPLFTLKVYYHRMELFGARRCLVLWEFITLKIADEK